MTPQAEELPELEGPGNHPPCELSEGTHPANAFQPLDCEVITSCCLDTQGVLFWYSNPSKLIQYLNTVSMHFPSLVRVLLPLSLLSSQDLKINNSLKSDPWDFHLTRSSSRDPRCRQWHHHPNTWTSQNLGKSLWTPLSSVPHPIIYMNTPTCVNTQSSRLRVSQGDSSMLLKTKNANTV